MTPTDTSYPVTPTDTPYPGATPTNTPHPIVSPTAPPALHPLLLTDGLLITYTLPTFPTRTRTATIRGTAICGSDGQYGVVTGPIEPATGSYLLTGGFSSGTGFATFVPGPGSIRLVSTLSWPLPAGGFQAVTVSYQDNLTIPVTWTAG